MARNPDTNAPKSLQALFPTLLWAVIVLFLAAGPALAADAIPTGSPSSSVESTVSVTVSEPGSASNLPARPGMKRVYRFGMVPWIAYSPLHVAAELGFWRKLGVEVTVVSYPTNPAMYRGIAGGDVDLCMDMIGSMVGMHLDGVDVKILGETDWSHGGDKIIVKRDLDVARLKARPIGVYLAKPSVTFFLNRFLGEWGLKIADVRIQELTMQELADAFIEGKFSVILNCDPEALRAERDGEGRQGVTSADFAGIIPEGVVSRADRFASIPRDDLVKIFRGWIQAVKWLHDPRNWNEFRRILNSHTFQADGPYSETDMQDMFRSVRIHPAATQARRNISAGGLRGYLQSVHDFLKDNDMLEREFFMDDILDNSALIEALKLEGEVVHP